MKIGRTLGFTLIELMVVVAVIGILAAIAFPSYQSVMVKNRRAAAQAHLIDIAQRQQLYLLDNRSYTSNLTSLGISTPSSISTYYVITAPVQTPLAFKATATPVTGSSQVADGILTLSNTGVKSPPAKW